MTLAIEEDANVRAEIVEKLKVDHYGRWNCLPGNLLEAIVDRICDEYEQLMQIRFPIDRLHEDCYTKEDMLLAIYHVRSLEGEIISLRP